MSLLFPQISTSAAVTIANYVHALAVREITAKHIELMFGNAEFTAVGGIKVTEDQLTDLRAGLLEFAEAAGFPDRSSDEQKAAFDAAAAIVLHKKMRLTLGEASKPGVWNFVSCLVAPDIVRWRFPGSADGTAVDRFLAGRRNTFQRVWWRAEVLRDDSSGTPYAILKALGEDELVQIMERPQLASYKPLAKEFAAGLVRVAEEHPHVPRRHLVRDAQKRLMRFSGYIKFEMLDEAELRRTVSAGYAAAVASYQKSSA